MLVWKGAYAMTKRTENNFPRTRLCFLFTSLFPDRTSWPFDTLWVLLSLHLSSLSSLLWLWLSSQVCFVREYVYKIVFKRHNVRTQPRLPLVLFRHSSTSLLSPSSSSSSDSAGKVLDFRRWRLHVINSNTQVISWSSYEIQNAEIQLLHVSISNLTLMYTRVHMFQSTFTCYHFLLQSRHSCHKAPPTHFEVTLRPKKVTKWRRHTKREKPTKIHCTFNKAHTMDWYH